MVRSRSGRPLAEAVTIVTGTAKTRRPFLPKLPGIRSGNVFEVVWEIFLLDVEVLEPDSETLVWRFRAVDCGQTARVPACRAPGRLYRIRGTAVFATADAQIVGRACAIVRMTTVGAGR